MAVALLLALAPAAYASDGGVSPGDTTDSSSGGSTTSTPAPPKPTSPTKPATPSPPKTTPGATATLASDGRIALAPASAPAAVKLAIAAANKLTRKPYIWGGGHRGWNARGYDCSGSVSYVLHAAGLLQFPLVSGGLAKWGAAGAGSWITVYANRKHVYMYVAGLRFDTSGAGEHGPRWRTDVRSNAGFKVRHPAGL